MLLVAKNKQAFVKLNGLSQQIIRIFILEVYIFYLVLLAGTFGTPFLHIITLRIIAPQLRMPHFVQSK